MVEKQFTQYIFRECFALRRAELFLNDTIAAHKLTEFLAVAQ